jgi:hypothetical protein
MRGGREGRSVERRERTKKERKKPVKSYSTPPTAHRDHPYSSLTKSSGAISLKRRSTSASTLPPIPIPPFIALPRRLCPSFRETGRELAAEEEAEGNPGETGGRSSPLETSSLPPPLPG